MSARLAILTVAVSATLLAACAGGSPDGKTQTASPPSPAATRAPAATATPVTHAATPAVNTPAPITPGSSLDALLQAPCGLLTDAEIAPIGNPSGPGAVVGKPGENDAVTPVVVTVDGITTSRCRWQLSDGSRLGAELYLLAAYRGPRDYAKQSLARYADAGQAASQPIDGIGEFAGVVIPSQRDTRSVAIFLAQKDDLAISVWFAGPADAAWPNADQLQALGAAVASRVF